MKQQKAETLQFWNDFYAQQESINKEWILQPNTALLDKLLLHGSSKNKALPRRILEIGCGTSTLSRDLFLHLRRQRQQQQQQQETQDDNNNDNVLQVVATDASELCIQQLRQRDAAVLDCSSGGALDYQVWNLTEPRPNNAASWKGSFDLVIDKGCLDTFLYRSRLRGTRKTELIHTVLRHIYATLCPRTGRYLVVSPRRKMNVFRDFPGFAVTRYELLHHHDDVNDSLVFGDLDGSDKQQQQQQQQQQTPPSTVYLHSGTPNPQYDPDTPQGSTAKPPQEEDVCPNCGLDFLTFRHGEALDGRGRAFWYRRWKGHCVHCRGGGEYGCQS